MPGGVDVAAVGLALLHHLGVAGDHLDPGHRGGVVHGGDDPAQVIDLEALFEDEAGGEVERNRAGHGKVVNRSVDGQVADVPAGEEQRRDDVGVGGQRDPRAVEVQLRRVLQRLEQRVAESVQEDWPRPASWSPCRRPVRHRDPLFLDPRAAAAGAVDALEHLLLADRSRQRLRGALGVPVVRVGQQLAAAGQLIVLAQRVGDPGRAVGLAQRGSRWRCGSRWPS